MIVAGQFVGGAFRVADGSARLSAGASGAGVLFDGTKLHEVGECQGERFSVVAFYHSSTKDLSSASRRKLVEMGFQLAKDAKPTSQELEVLNSLGSGLPPGGRSQEGWDQGGSPALTGKSTTSSRSETRTQC